MNTVKTQEVVDKVVEQEYDGDPSDIVGWDDFDFSVNNLRVNPATTKPDFDYDESEFLFDPASTETVVGSKISRHSFKLGTGVVWKPHVHWLQEATGVVKWQLEYKFIEANGREPTSWTTITTVDTEFTWSAGDPLHQISVFPDIDMSSYTSTAIECKVKVSRLGGDAADTYALDARFMGFDIHTPRDQPRGSRQEFIK